MIRRFVVLVAVIALASACGARWEGEEQAAVAAGGSAAGLDGGSLAPGADAAVDAAERRRVESQVTQQARWPVAVGSVAPAGQEARQARRGRPVRSDKGVTATTVTVGVMASGTSTAPRRASAHGRWLPGPGARKSSRS